MKGRRLLAALLATVAAACGDPLSINARDPVAEEVLVLYAITGTPLAAPSALSTLDRAVLRLPSASFDLAFDIDAQGQVVLYPVQLVGTGFGQTGILKQPGVTFESVTRAPSGPYEETVPTTAALNELHVIRARPPACSGALKGREIYSKLVVTAVDPATRAITVRLRVDPNCGFRDFGEGVPKD